MGWGDWSNGSFRFFFIHPNIQAIKLHLDRLTYCHFSSTVKTTISTSTNDIPEILCIRSARRTYHNNNDEWLQVVEIADG